MSVTLRVTHKAIGAEVRRDPYDIVVDGELVGSVPMNGTFELTLAAGRHSLQLRSGRKSSRDENFDSVDGDLIAYRCTGKRFLPLFLASFVNPRLALVLVRQ